MGYRIAYQSMQKKTKARRFSKRLPLLILLCFSLFVLIVEKSWQDGAAFLNKRVLQSGEMIPAAAWNGFAEELRQGASVLDALIQFCRQSVS